MGPMRRAVLILLLSMTACTRTEPPSSQPPADPLAAKIAQFAPVDVSADTAALPANERDALAHLVRAAQFIDGLFLEQVWAGNPAMLTALAADRSAPGRSQLHYFLINKGPWDRIDRNAAFVTGPAAALLPHEKPPQANFYPLDATKDEIDRWMGGLKGPLHDQATGFFSVIRRAGGGAFAAVPYNVEYQNTLTQIAAHLRAAAEKTAQPALKTYLSTRADALLSNDYFASDMAWMELDASIEPTIG